ncbi:MAG: PTS sugar transporter subunit IIA [Actinomycetota bacterium]
MKSPLSGKVVPLEEVADEVFSERVMGDGVAVRPTEGRVLAPASGTIEKLFPGGHGVVIETPEGVQILVHVGLDTVELKGDGFDVHAAEGETTAEGRLLVTVDLDRMAELKVDLVSPVVVISGHSVEARASGDVAAGDDLFGVL